MTTSVTAHPPQRHGHPAPHRGRLSGFSIWFAILAAPVAWSVQQLVNSGITAHGCYPHAEPIASPLWQGLGAAGIWVAVVACLVCLVSAVVAWRNWRTTSTERAGGSKSLIEGGEGRTRFMAMVGLLSSGLFLLAVLLASAGLFILGACI
jgi:hypothetical protein